MTTPELPAAPVCAATGCTRPAAPTALLCPADVQRLGDWIAQVGDQYAQLSAAPSLQGREPGTGGGGSLASQKSPALLGVLTLKDRRSRERDDEDPDGNGSRGVLEVLESWARLVREQRDLAPPTLALAYRRQAAPPGPVCDLDAAPCGHHTCWAWTFRTTVAAPVTVLSERRVLAQHFDWIVTQDWVDELHADMRAIWTQLQSANGHATRPGYVAVCACGGRMRWKDGAARCGSCGRTVAAPAEVAA